jgi:hypothetical protein
MKSDLHVHTTFSDGICDPEEVVYIASMVGLDCIAITDHDTMDGVGAAINAGYKHNVKVIPGIEVTSKDGHILGIGVKNIIPSGMRWNDTINSIHRAGGVAIAAHPFSLSPPGCKKKPGFDGIEVWNGGPILSWIPNIRAMYYWMQNVDKFAAVGGSDTHYPITLGTIMTLSEDTDVVRAIRDRKTSIVLNPIDWKTVPYNVRKKVNR